MKMVRLGIMYKLYPNHWAPADSKADESWAVCLSFASQD